MKAPPKIFGRDETLLTLSHAITGRNARLGLVSKAGIHNN